eukprot:276796_1
MSLRLKDKRCVITGAASGIGAAIAVLFAERGCDLILLDVASLDNTVKSIKQISPHCNIYDIKCDISSEKQIKSATQLIKNKYGKKSVNVLVNNAATFMLASVMDATPEQWRKMLDVNVVGAATLIKYLVPLMKHDSTSSIINIGSICSFRALEPDRATYNVTKAAILQLTKNAAVDLWDKYQIRVNSVCPGVILTKALEDEGKLQIETGIRKDWKDYQNNYTKRLIMNRIGDPRDVALACLFFASDDSKYCTGSNLMVDAGWSAL